MSIASIGETLENPSVTQIMAAYLLKKYLTTQLKLEKLNPLERLV
jgi:isopropylmalate/homocitrate/citramalate synthase